MGSVRAVQEKRQQSWCEEAVPTCREADGQIAHLAHQEGLHFRCVAPDEIHAPIRGAHVSPVEAGVPQSAQGRYLAFGSDVPQLDLTLPRLTDGQPASIL